MSDVAKVANTVLPPAVADLVGGIANDVSKVVGGAAGPAVDLVAAGLKQPLPLFERAKDAFSTVQNAQQIAGMAAAGGAGVSAIPLPFSALSVVDPARFIKDAFLNPPAAASTTTAGQSLRPSTNILAGAGEIDRLMDEARATLSDPNAKFEDKLAAQQKMSTAMTLFQFFSALVKQLSDMQQTVNQNLK